jgi:hypothetical protein
MISKTPPSTNAISYYQIRNREEIPPTVCTACGRDFKTRENLRDHLKVTFDLDEEVMRFTSFSLGLPLDTQVSVTDSYILEKAKPEEEEENSLLNCPFCCLNFKNNKGLKQHIGKRHSARKKSAQCSICSKRFTHKYALKFHISQVHEKRTRVECPKCGKVVYNKYMLDKHISKEHKEDV